MTPEGREWAQSLKLVVVAVGCAVFTATLVISAGEALLRRAAQTADPAPLLMQTSDPTPTAPS